MNQSRRAGRTAPQRSAAGRTVSPRSGMLFHVPSFSIGLVLGAAVVLTTGYLPELLAPPQPTKTAATAGTNDPAQQPLRFEFDTILRTTPAPVTAGTVEAGQPAGPLPDGTIPTDATGQVAGIRTGEVESATPGIVDGTGPTVTTSVPLAADTTTLPAAPGTVAGTPVRVEDRTPAVDGAVTPAPPSAAPEPAAAQPAPATAYMLQAASFRSRADADRLRAELLLLDLPATTGEVNVGNSVWYRVTVGPFPDQVSTDAAKERLRERNLTAIPFRR